LSFRGTLIPPAYGRAGASLYPWIGWARGRHVLRPADPVKFPVAARERMGDARTDDRIYWQSEVAIEESRKVHRAQPHGSGPRQRARHKNEKVPIPQPLAENAPW
jgi:hypothetical protein